MFNSISGILTGKNTNTVFVRTFGIEWEISVSSFTADFFTEADKEIKVYTWLYHREDQMRIFGFQSEAERSVFLDLTKVDGIGPKQAIKILSGISVKDLEAALESGNIDKLQAVPGIGKKTAQKMALALKGKLTDLSAETKPLKSEFEDIAAALADMGFDKRSAAEEISRIASSMRSSGKDPAKNEDELFRLAIVNLS